MFLELTDLNDKLTVINAEKIISFTEKEDGTTQVYFGNDNDCIDVKQSRECIMQQMFLKSILPLN